MSHFTVTVRLTSERLARHNNDVKAALDEILAPFCERTTDERYIEFRDEEDEMRKKYETETTKRVRMPDGRLLLPWDETFRVPGTFGTGGGSHKVPDGLECVQVPYRETFPTFEAYAKEWCGHDGPDEKAKRYGYWRNPNAKWDWWAIGGRWTGYYPLKADAKPRLGRPGAFDNKAEKGHGDIVRVSDIDMAAVAAAETKAAEKFWDEYQRFLAGEKFPAFEGPRSKALDMGLVEVAREPVTEPKPGTRVFSWERDCRPDDDRRHWSDVAKLITRDEFFREYFSFFDKIATYAGLDDAGWVQPGQMYMFASSDATPQTTREYHAQFRPRFIDACGPDDLLVAVDCHI